MKSPYLIQRCVKQKFKPKFKISEWLKLEYMGSSEFEFGSVPKSLRMYHSVSEKILTGEHNILGKTIYYLCLPEDKEYVEKFLEDYKEGPYGYKNRTKEFTSIGKIIHNDTKSIYQKDDFWFCIDEDFPLVISFDKVDLKNFLTCIKNSVNFMNAQKDI